ncbi:MAG: DNA-processing protein DprA, partial [Eggerthellaceae bacterium]|nr:DNA-processing protein DprA [Eggerthellaceae bacterium]
MIEGPRTVLEKGAERYPASFLRLAQPPKELYVVGDPAVLQEGLAVVGARRATPYGISCAKRFAGMAASRGVTIISGGARGCDAAAHRAALAEGCPTVVFLGGGCDQLYPAEHHDLFQRVVDAGGAVVSEQPWGFPPQPYTFRLRNRLIASLAKATLIVEAGLPSGTFSTADEALAASRDVLVVPGAITSASSHGANRLIAQGAVPIVDDESFSDALFSIFGCLRQESAAAEGDAENAENAADAADESSGFDAVFAEKSRRTGRRQGSDTARSSRCAVDPLLQAMQAEPLGMEALRLVASECCSG